MKGTMMDPLKVYILENVHIYSISSARNAFTGTFIGQCGYPGLADAV